MPTEINNRSNRRFSQIEFDEDKHLYYVGGKQIPSVTDILSPLHRSYGNINPSVLEYARQRGTAVHEALQMLATAGKFIIKSVDIAHIPIQATSNGHPKSRLIYRRILSGVQFTDRHG